MSNNYSKSGSLLQICQKSWASRPNALEDSEMGKKDQQQYNNTRIFETWEKKVNWIACGRKDGH